MMEQDRENKFRVWSTIGELKMIYLKSGLISDLVTVRNQWEVMQFTGRKDSDGVEIYEKDIIQFTVWWFDGSVAETQLTGTIVYSNAYMSFQLKGIKNEEWERHTGYCEDNDYLTPFSELTFADEDLKVIGNVFENPKLIGG